MGATVLLPCSLLSLFLVSTCGTTLAREALGTLTPAVLWTTQVIVATDDPKLVIVGAATRVADLVPGLVS